jgi:16S rRNA C1402 (ribose-2'-O) methylase RsmI
VASRFTEAPKGEVTLVFGGEERPGEGVPVGEAVAAVDELVAAGIARRQAADVVARLSQVSRNTLYAESLKSR